MLSRERRDGAIGTGDVCRDDCGGVVEYEAGAEGEG